MRIVNVRLLDRAYPIFIGVGASRQLANLVRDLGGIGRVAIVADRRVADLHLERVVEELEIRASVLSFPPGERSKSLRQLEQLYDGLAQARIGRRDLIVTLGGGVAGDLGGFAAATWMRGIRFVQMPTTLEAAIDASIGGKTAVNHPAGKNLIGAFHQPAAVIIELDFLNTLSRRDYVAGQAESVKHAVIRDPAFFEWQEQHVEGIGAREAEVLEQLIARNCEIKVDVVARDEREENLRMILNYGHTIGHAIEHLLGYELRHGECVGLGIIVENELARVRGILTPDVAERVASLIERLGLPTRLPRALEPGKVAAACRMDKKVRRDAVNFVLVKGLAAPQRLTGISGEEIAAALMVVQPA
ncbi:MAG: 3-dehydroquinate synthase [Phycisphaerae bacterium]